MKMITLSILLVMAPGPLLMAQADACSGTPTLEARADQVYDSTIYKWYFEGELISGNTAAIVAEEAGAYAVEITGFINGDAWVTQQTFTVLPVLAIEDVQIDHPGCRESSGSLEIKVNRAAGVRYSINGKDFQTQNFFEGLAAGTYLLTVQDNLNCTDSRNVVLGSGSLPVLEKLESTPAACGAENGRILFEVSGGSGQITASINGGAFAAGTSFEHLGQGEYQLTFTDEAGCMVEAKTMVPGAGCPLYVPNAFSPNKDGINDLFQIGSTLGFNATINTYSIFDRWGKLVYQARHFPASSNDQWWDGTLGGKEAGAGVYIYLIELEFSDGTKEGLQGEVYLVR